MGWFTGAAKPRRSNHITKQTQLNVGFSILISRLLFPMPIRKRTKHAVQEKQNNAKAFQNLCVHKLFRGPVYSYRRYPRE